MCDTFVRSETRDVVEFIKEVERHPCIYNYTLPEYSSRVETKRAWQDISEKFNCQEHICKEKWRKIRIAFMRSLKQQKSTVSSVRPYYLYDHLTFVLPFTKLNDEPAPKVASPVSSEDDHFDNDLLEVSCYKKEVLSESEDDSIHITNSTTNEVNPLTNHAVFLEERDRKRSVELNIGRQGQNPPIEQKKIKISDNIENNPRKMFLLSLWPDIENFTDKEMRTFRSSVINCIDKIMDERSQHDGH